MIGSPATTVLLRIHEPSQVGEVRRLATAMAGVLDFSVTDAGRVGILVTEAAGNLVKHAQHGELLLRALEREDGVAGLEILSLDRGPGMVDTEKCLQDGFSSAGSPGTGLGAMRRVASEFDLYSRPQVGTAVLMRLWRKPVPAQASWYARIGGVAIPFEGEQLCGDAWAVAQTPGRAIVMVADGLGHGPFAAEAACEAVNVFREASASGPAEIIHGAHAALRATRGAAVAVAEIKQGQVRFAGIGNIAGVVLSEGNTRSLISHNGIVGHEMRKVREVTYPWPSQSLLIMNSDGLQSRWNLDRYPGIQNHDPALIAGTLYRDFKRARDDVTVVVCRTNSEGGG